jgi:steroid delta-isomerase-like uncharacterized protein
MSQAQFDLQGYMDAWNAHDAGRVAAYYTDDAQYEDVAMGIISRGKEQIKQFAEATFRSSPDLKFELVSGFVAGDRAASEWVMSGTHQGDFPGLPASGKPVSIRGASALELDGDKIRRSSDYWNLASLLQQMGQPPAG